MTEPEKIRSNAHEGLMDKPITIKAVILIIVVYQIISALLQPFIAEFLYADKIAECKQFDGVLVQGLTWRCVQGVGND